MTRTGLSRLFWLLVALSALGASPALAWDPFRSESRDVERGNEHLQKGQPKEALAAYDTAAQKLPGDPGVQLNRGLALMAQGKLDGAREAFKQGTQGRGSREVRAESYYNLGLAFMMQAEQSAKADKLEEAQSKLREAVDALKSSLRNGPKNRDAAWNLELARRRLVDVDKKRDEQKKNEEQKKNDEQKKNEDEKQDGQDPKESDKSDPGKSGEPPKEDKSGDKSSDPKPKDDGKTNAPGPQPQKPDAKPDAGAGEEEGASAGKPLPKAMQQALDSLSSGEENLEKLRARMRATRQPRRVQKDW